MTNAIYELLRKAKDVSGRLDELGHGANVDRAAQLVNSFIDAIESEPNANGLNKASHALSWHIADQFEPLPQSLEISNLSSNARRIAKAMLDSNT
jgi:diketogulonate reductase-like aldo/keto reductase